MKNNPCRQCKYYRMTFIETWSSTHCVHPTVAPMEFNPVYGKYQKYVDCNDARQTVCQNGVFFIPSKFTKIKRKIRSLLKCLMK